MIDIQREVGKIYKIYLISRVSELIFIKGLKFISSAWKFYTILGHQYIA